MSVQNTAAGVEPADADDPAERRRSAIVLAGLLILSFAVVLFGNIITQPAVEGWYATARKSPLVLPFWAASSFWTIVHILTSVAAWLVWRERHRRRVTGALSLYFTQLVLNALWRPVLLSLTVRLGETAIWLAAVIMSLLIVTVITMIREFWHINRGAALMLLPYLAWCVYALSNNIFLGVLNEVVAG
ncbi:TspO/MBR family protein [Lysobacter korlensis]|uniref:TspO/MBR family protein n=1 Tax=Lysobacter korlensis TaxID=553636 RepID=A0ABV6RZU0_9GAMM